MVKIITLLGAPGSGKGTIAKIISKALKLPHISTGDLLRLEIAKKTDLGLQVEGLLSNGILVGDDIITLLLKNKLQEKDCKNGFILDGYPRTIKQLELINTIINKDDNLVFEIYLEEDTIIKRVSGRYSCNECGQIYNDYGLNPKINGVCDICKKSNFAKRKDDSVETIIERLNTYKQQTLPIVKHYKELGLLHTIRGDLKEVSIIEYFESKID